MYDDKYFFVNNPLNRYSIGPRQNLKTNPDGITTWADYFPNPRAIRLRQSRRSKRFTGLNIGNLRFFFNDKISL